jgi:putative endonuclease
MPVFQVYILWSETFKKSYVGFTSDLDQRLLSHNHLATKGWTIRFKPWQLVVSFPCIDKKEAMCLEKFYKTGTGRSQLKSLLREKGFFDSSNP